MVHWKEWNKKSCARGDDDNDNNNNNNDNDNNKRNNNNDNDNDNDDNKGDGVRLVVGFAPSGREYGIRILP